MRKHSSLIYIVSFVVVAYLLLPVANGDYLRTIEDNSFFATGHTFMADTVAHHGGWAAWAACWMTQFLYHPWLGATILITCWVAIFLLVSRLFLLRGAWRMAALVPSIFLLFNVLDYGYWIYYAKTPGFAFRPTLLTLAVTATACLVTEAMRKFAKCRWASSPAVPALSLVLLTALSPMAGEWSLNNHRCSILVTLFDKNFKSEMRMYRSLDRFQFDEVLREMDRNGDAPTNLMVFYKNIALVHTGRLGEMFTTPNCGQSAISQLSDSLMTDGNGELQVRTSQLGAPLIYLLFGQTNYAYRWAMENSVQYGQSFRNMKIMALSAALNQERDVAAKYIAQLKTSLFHRKWAAERERWLMSSTAFLQSEEWQILSPLMGDHPNELDSDDGLCQKYIMEHYALMDAPANALVEDITMCFSLWAKNSYAYCVHFYDYTQRHARDPFPELYQQGAILFGNAEDSPITVNQFKFDAVVSDRYNRFVEDYNALAAGNLNEREMGEKLRPLYGDTYWWYYYFYTDFTIY